MGVLRFATVAIDQRGGRARRKPDVRPVFERIAVLRGRLNNACRDQLVIPTAPRLRPECWGYQLGHDASVRRHRDALSGFDSTDVSAQVVLQLPNASFHSSSIATCGHICLAPVNARDRACAVVPWRSCSDYGIATLDFADVADVLAAGAPGVQRG